MSGWEPFEQCRRATHPGGSGDRGSARFEYDGSLVHDCQLPARCYHQQRRDISEPLHNCPAHYFDVPNGVSLSLPAINEATISGHGRATGFAMAEEIYDRFPALANHEQPRIIFYSASNGSVVTSQCARVVTNRTDVLLQNVVSLLEELHWPSLSINGALADRSSSSNP
jgi:hypothetical protein